MATLGDDRILQGRAVMTLELVNNRVVVNSMEPRKLLPITTGKRPLDAIYGDARSVFRA